MTNQKLIRELENTIENIPDFPKPGIQFKDITPIFLKPDLYEDIITIPESFPRLIIRVSKFFETLSK